MARRAVIPANQQPTCFLALNAVEAATRDQYLDFIAYVVKLRDEWVVTNIPVNSRHPFCFGASIARRFISNFRPGSAIEQCSSDRFVSVAYQAKSNTRISA
jgi:hypothetical protein